MKNNAQKYIFAANRKLSNGQKVRQYMPLDYCSKSKVLNTEYQ